MNKYIASVALVLSLASASVALAQTYSTGCISAASGLALGSRGQDVTNLQTFLVAQNYPGGGSWMITGYFGQATAAALRNFQQTQGIAQTGTIDPATASAISRVSCKSVVPVAPSSVYPSPSYPTPYPLYAYGASPSITSLSQNTGMPGNVVTIYGVGFDQWNNTVNVGSTQVSGIASQNGTSLTFTVPSHEFGYSLTGTTLQLSVSNSRGTSNTLSFTIWGALSTCGTYPYGSCGCSNLYPYNTGYNSSSYCLPPNTATPVISYLNPTSGGVGTTVTVYGSGFSPSGNSVRFGAGVITNLTSHDGRSVSFTVPVMLTGFGSQPVTLSTYQVSVTNASGRTSNTAGFMVTQLVGSNGSPTITSVNGPTNLAVGNSGTWTAMLNTMNNPYLTLSVNWGDQNVYGGAAANQQIYNVAQQTNTLTHTYYTTGTYTITFIVSNGMGQQNSFTTTVVVGSGMQGNLSLAYLSPQSGRPGTQVQISGQGFGLNDNTVHFGNGGLMHVPSINNGTTIYYTIPSYLSPCDVQNAGGACALYAQQVTPGQYPIYVSSGSGNSNTLTFTVVQ